MPAITASASTVRKATHPLGLENTPVPVIKSLPTPKDEAVADWMEYLMFLLGDYTKTAHLAAKTYSTSGISAFCAQEERKSKAAKSRERRKIIRL
jgi:hypothetical protein